MLLDHLDETVEAKSTHIKTHSLFLFLETNQTWMVPAATEKIKNISYMKDLEIDKSMPRKNIRQLPWILRFQNTLSPKLFLLCMKDRLISDGSNVLVSC